MNRKMAKKSVKRVTAAQRRRLIEDIVSARHDLLALAEAHELSPQQLGAWISEPANYRLLAGLCVLADVQTQILLSRYRLVAAGRLIKLATEEGEGDMARRACVDLLKLDLKRAGGEVMTAGEDDDTLPDPETLYGA